MTDPVDLTVGPPGPQRADGAVLRSIALDQGDPTEAGPGAPGVPEGEPPLVDEWMVRGVTRTIVEGGLRLLVGAPRLTDDDGHLLARVTQKDLADADRLWRFTDDELDALIPPLTRIINRRPAWRSAVIRGDEAALAVIFAGYLGHNVADRRRLTRRVRDDELAGEVPGGPGPSGGDAARAAGGDQPRGAGGVGVH